MTITTEISNSEDVISFDDITQRVEALRSERDDFTIEDGSDSFDEDEDRDNSAAWADENPDEALELAHLESVLADTKGYGGDHQWEGDWYPGSMIHPDHFVEYCKELCSDIGDLPKELPAYIAIDWDKTADNIKVDYSTVEFDGVDYLYR